MRPMTSTSAVQLGIVPTHIKFAGGLAPGPDGKFPREADGRLTVVAEVSRVCESSPVPLHGVQISYFAGSDPSDLAEMVEAFGNMGLEPQFILMVGGANPMNPSDEDRVVSQLKEGLRAAVNHGVRQVASTSIEEWMSPTGTKLEGAEFEAAIDQNVKVHLRAYEEAGLAGSVVESWHMEFLRPGEFKTFTNLGRVFQFTQAANAALGRTFFKILVDAAHCGDSGHSIPENEAWIAQIAAAGQLGSFHASVKTTRGCISTDDGWVSALLTAAAKTGELRQVFVEVFHHEDDALAALRALDPGHGIDTCDGRSYTEVVVDNLADVAKRLNNLTARGILPRRG
jgi:hypothetical protein